MRTSERHNCSSFAPLFAAPLSEYELVPALRDSLNSLEFKRADVDHEFEYLKLMSAALDQEIVSIKCKIASGNPFMRVLGRSRGWVDWRELPRSRVSTFAREDGRGP